MELDLLHTFAAEDLHCLSGRGRCCWRARLNIGADGKVGRFLRRWEEWVQHPQEGAPEPGYGSAPLW